MVPLGVSSRKFGQDQGVNRSNSQVAHLLKGIVGLLMATVTLPY